MALNLAEQRFGNLTVLRRAPNFGRHSAWLCKCDCGKERVIRGVHLHSGAIRTCGIGHYFKSMMLPLVATDEERIWRHMLARCYNKKSVGYKYYGKRGVRVCARWRKSFSQFLSDMGPRPSPEHSVDRYPNYRGNYEPNNCRWATDKEQSRNRAGVLRVVIDGQLVLLKDYTERVGISNSMVRKRLARGWLLEDALTLPSRSRGRLEDYPADWISGEARKEKL
jgi:hypothetical protein